MSEVVTALADPSCNIIFGAGKITGQPHHKLLLLAYATASGHHMCVRTFLPQHI